MRSGSPLIRSFMVSKYSLSGYSTSYYSLALSLSETLLVLDGSEPYFLPRPCLFVLFKPPPVSEIIGLVLYFPIFYVGRRGFPAALPEFFEDWEGGLCFPSYELFLIVFWFCMFIWCGSPLGRLGFAAGLVPLVPFKPLRESNTDFKFFILSQPGCFMTDDTTGF